MVAELVRLRFANGDVKRRLEAAQTKTQTALAWQYFASVSQKYRKLKCIYRKEKREEGKTGNCARSLREIDDGLWSILHDAFSGKVGISGKLSPIENDGLGSLAATLERHHEETRRFQAIQLQLLQQLLARKNA
ncbi:uncharacterized protein PITG_19139 [Phytophthora infestans T30-4]|uniref:Uncharacterized protein n=1 Tax=Phytophthora infestans (strain T30-4) TaxID=403677 RepID=D0NYX5_PHYIT|nr:uncharacterized protein PITG_19139 [Phytophthora infestans T30-4]EEY68758.1 conserved hypothetical protein [Phytophthora infestans T30-4]|eukprot:XP_002997450.1 conserved hypothetical protein [Phytophthora infestans T30-4]